MLDTTRADAERVLETCVPGIYNVDDNIRQLPDGLCSINDKHHEYADDVHDP